MSIHPDTVAEFGRSMGMNNLQVNHQGGVVLNLSNIGTLAIDVAGSAKDSVVVSLARRLPRANGVNWSRLLAFTHYRARLPVRMQLGTFRDEIILAVTLAPEDFTLPKIHEVIRVLDRQHQAMGDVS